MSKKQQQWNIIEQQEAEYTRKIIAELKDIGWAKPLVDLIDKHGVCETTRHRAFEARFGYLIHSAGLTPTLDFQAGVDETDIDYMIPSDPEVLAELVCIDETTAIVEETEETRLAPGIVMRESLTTSRDENARLQPGGEVHMLKRKVMKKVYKGKITKFPVPSGRLQVIIVNDKGLSADGLLIEEHMQALYGVGPLKKNGYMTWASTVDGEYVTGIMEDDDVGARLIRERIHAIGIMTEYYEAGQYKARLDFFINSGLIDLEAFTKQWPLSKNIETRIWDPDSKFELESRPGWGELPINHP